VLRRLQVTRVHYIPTDGVALRLVSVRVAPPLFPVPPAHDPGLTPQAGLAEMGLHRATDWTPAELPRMEAAVAAAYRRDRQAQGCALGDLVVMLAGEGDPMAQDPVRGARGCRGVARCRLDGWRGGRGSAGTAAEARRWGRQARWESTTRHGCGLGDNPSLYPAPNLDHRDRCATR
jgi:hypothetical protein